VGALYKSILLFVLNWLDAQLTVLWVRLNIATEGNGLMARVLNFGETPFLLTKLAIGFFSAYVLYRFAHLPIARRGLAVVLAVYFALIGVHTVTGFSALGWRAPGVVLTYFLHLPESVGSLFG